MTDVVTSPLPPDEKPTPRVKDPQRVTAGLILAEKNRQARAALARETARGAEPVPEEATPEEPQKPNAQWSTNTLLGIGGLTIGMIGLFLQYQQKPRSQVVATPPAKPSPKAPML